jgi:hypothetical protein
LGRPSTPSNNPLREPRGRGDVYAGAARVQEGVGSGDTVQDRHNTGSLTPKKQHLSFDRKALNGANGSRHLWDLNRNRFQQVYTRLTLLILLGYQIEMSPEHTITLEATYPFIRQRRTWEKCSLPLQAKHADISVLWSVQYVSLCSLVVTSTKGTPLRFLETFRLP